MAPSFCLKIEKQVPKSLPLSLQGLIPDDESVRLLSHELEDLDYSLLY